MNPPDQPASHAADQMSANQPGGRISAADIEERIRGLVGRASSSIEDRSTELLVPVVAAVMGMVVLAFLFGRRRGRKKTTTVQVIRR